MRQRRRGARAAVAVAAALGSGSIASVLAAGSAAHAAATQSMWVVNSLTNNVTSYPYQPTTPYTGAPTSEIDQSGSGATLSPDQPLYAEFDSSGNLWVTNQLGGQTTGGSISEYAKADLVTGTTTPTPIAQLQGTSFTLPGSTSQTGSIDNPSGFAFDNSGDLWLADHNANVVEEFSKAQLQNLANDPAPMPAVVLYGSAPTGLTAATTLFNGPNDLAFDAQGNLWVVNENDMHSTDPTQGFVEEFSQADIQNAQATGGMISASPTLTITQATDASKNITLDVPKAMTFDGAGNLWVVADSGGSLGSGLLVRYKAADLTQTGVQALQPDIAVNNTQFNVTGSANAYETIDSPNQLVYDTASNMLWLANFCYGDCTPSKTGQYPTINGAVVGWSDTALSAGGPVQPTSYIAGDSTKVMNAVGIAIGDPPTTPSGGGTTTTTTPPSTGGGGTPPPPPPPPPPVTTTPPPVTTTPPPAPTPLVAPMPLGLSGAALATPATATTKSGAAASLSAVAGTTSFEVNVPDGALPDGSAVSLFAVTNGANLVPRLPHTDGYLAAFAVTWASPNASSAVAATAIDATVSDPAILPGDVVYAVQGGILKKVATATVAGHIEVGFTSAPILVVAQPPRVRAPLATATLKGHAVELRLICETGGVCKATGNVTVMHKVMRNGKQVLAPLVLAHLRLVAMRPGASRAVGFPLTAAGRKLLANHHGSYRAGVVLTLDGGARTVRTVVIR